MNISSQFDGGNIIVKSAKKASDIQLEIRKDNGSHFYQWFYFRLAGAAGKDCTLKIMNAGKAAYPGGFEDYRVCVSYDREHWFRLDTKYDGKTLSWSHTPTKGAVYYAYFAPYSMERHADLVAGISESPYVEQRVLGQTLDGQDLDLLVIGDPGSKPKKIFWVTARQHPGETMAEWWAEGFLERLVDEHDPVSRKLLDQVRFYVIPNINPDGSRRGHLRTNAIGKNLNREWDKSTMENSPEVFLTLRAMEKYGMDFHLDVHGDEALPYNFLIGIEGIPKLTAKLTKQYEFLQNRLCELSPDFQKKHGYPQEKPGKANLSIASNYIANHYRVFSTTLKMPFKDNADLPDQDQGWSPERCIRLGRTFVDGLWSYAQKF